METMKKLELRTKCVSEEIVQYNGSIWLHYIVTVRAISIKHILWHYFSSANITSNPVGSGYEDRVTTLD